jgi:L-fuculose-phosphate aldolase
VDTLSEVLVKDSPELSLMVPQVQVAVARRILALNGCESGVGGHVSIRNNASDSFFITPQQYFEETVPADVIQLGFDLRPVGGDGPVSPAAEFHSSIYQARPDVNAVIHTHSFWVSVLSSTRRLIGRYDTDAAIFFDRQARYDESADKPLVGGAEIVEALGPTHLVLIMSNHGAIVVGQTLEDATITALKIEHCAHLQLASEAAGGDELSIEILERFKKPKMQYHVPQMWNANVRRVRRLSPEIFRFP